MGRDTGMTYERFKGFMKQLILLLLCLLLSGVSGYAKNADLAGKWYSPSPVDLQAELRGYLNEAHVPEIEGTPIAFIVPHAGFRFSGKVAAYSYKLIEKINPKTIVLVGFSHHNFKKDTASVLTDDYFSTPLGKIFVDKEMSKTLLESSDIFKDLPEAYQGENSIELQIPFIQIVSPKSKIVVLALMDQSEKNLIEISRILTKTLKQQDDYILIASTDLSHYLKYDEARVQDLNTIEKIKEIDPQSMYRNSLLEDHKWMCGYGALYVVMNVAKNLGAESVEVLKYMNSGDTAGNKNRVVGYLSAVMAIEDKGKEAVKMLSKEECKKMLILARTAITNYLDTGKHLKLEKNEFKEKTLNEKMGAFVTLHKGGDLRGCIGHMESSGPLYETVAQMAVAAAVQDPRFTALTKEELDEIDLEISALSPMKKIDDHNEIQVGTHGVMVRKGLQGGVYLPQVADEAGWNKEEFLNSLCGQKAGIPADSWKTGECDMYIFTAEVFGEKDYE